MDLPLQVMIGFGEFVGACCLGHFLYRAMKAPEKMSLGLATVSGPQTWGDRVYLALVALTWVVFVFAGAKKLFFWMPNDAAMTFAAILSLASLTLLTHLEQAAYWIHRYRRELRVREELVKLIQQGYSPSQHNIDYYLEKSRTADSEAEREACNDLAAIVKTLANRDTKLCEDAIAQVRREAEDDARREEQAAASAEEQAEKIKEYNRLKQRVAQTITVLPSTKTVEVSLGSEALLNLPVFQQKWQLLHDFAQAIGKQGVASQLSTLLKPIAGVHVKEGAIFRVVMNGSERDGSYEIRSVVSGTEGDLLDGLTFEQSQDGLIAAFYMRMALPGQLAWGHGMYNKDQQLLVALDQVIMILQRDDVKADHAGLAGLTVPPGLRIRHEADGAMTMLCLANYPNGGFKDCAVSLESGKASAAKVTTLFDTGRRVFY